MDHKDTVFLKKLLETFRTEAEEHIKALSAGLIDLEKESESEKQKKTVEIIFREAHSLKGAARAVNMGEIETICQSLESMFSAWKREYISPTSEWFDVLHQVIDNLTLILISPDKQRKEIFSKTISLLGQLGRVVKDSFPPEDKKNIVPTLEQKSSPEAKFEPVIPVTLPVEKKSDENKSISPETVRISTDKMDTLLLQTEELISTRLFLEQHVSELKEINASLAGWKKKWSIFCPALRALQQEIEKNNELDSPSAIPSGMGNRNPAFCKLVEYFDWNNSFMKSLDDRLETLTKGTTRDIHSLGGIVDRLHEDTRKVLMFPFSSLLEIFPKLVRDLSRDRGKDVNLVVQGSEIEIDRRILERMKDPLTHLVRNSLDHGIEDPSIRKQRKKPTQGTIHIGIVQKENSKVEILVADDGAGIDSEKVLSAAVKSGFLNREDADKITDQEIVALIFHSGLTTSQMITDISGRGLGLAIVKEKVEKLGGKVTVETQINAGTTFRIVLPLSMAAFHGILFRVEEYLFIISSTNVDRVVRVRKEDIKTVENRDTIQLNGKVISLVRMSDVLGIQSKNSKSESSGMSPVILLSMMGKQIAFVVEEILNEQEVLVKSLGKQFTHLRNISGATVLGTGKVVPILNVSDLIQSAVESSTTGGKPTVVSAEKAKVKRQNILVVEDSITARTLLKNILESAGYQVKTAVDGVDGFTLLKTETFDLVVSDVDMPRMSGFELTTKIRADMKLANLPVVLVTALESREDRERGIDVGANAYIVKKSFDQSNLLEVITRFI